MGGPKDGYCINTDTGWHRASSPALGDAEWMAKRARYDLGLPPVGTRGVAPAYQVNSPNLIFAVPELERYSRLTGQLPQGQQANHGNEVAVYGNKRGGLTWPMFGDATQEPGQEHFEYHRLLTERQRPYRPGGPLANRLPTNRQVLQWKYEILTELGYDEVVAKIVTDELGAELRRQGRDLDDPIPCRRARASCARRRSLSAASPWLPQSWPCNHPTAQVESPLLLAAVMR